MCYLNARTHKTRWRVWENCTIRTAEQNTITEVVERYMHECVDGKAGVVNMLGKPECGIQVFLTFSRYLFGEEVDGTAYVSFGVLQNNCKHALPSSLQRVSVRKRTPLLCSHLECEKNELQSAPPPHRFFLMLDFMSL